MNPIDHNILEVLLNANDTDQILTSESPIIEFKQEFNWADKRAKAKYAKTMAAFSNHKGGYLVFGIEDQTKKVIGVTNQASVDNASITSFVNSCFQPHIVYHRTSFEVNSKVLEVIYVEKSANVVVCMKDCEEVMKESDIYYRYNGKSDKMKPADLLHLLNDLKTSNSNTKARKSDIKPIFESRGGSRGGASMEVSDKYENIGGRAFIKRIESLEGSEVDFQFSEQTVSTGQKYVLYGRARSRNPQYSIRLHFEDIDGNKYYQKMELLGGGNKVELPVELN